VVSRHVSASTVPAADCGERTRTRFLVGLAPAQFSIYCVAHKRGNRHTALSRSATELRDLRLGELVCILTMPSWCGK
jgi:hypothetical protein